MADALVSIALEKLTDFVGQQLSLFAGATHELENLSHTFESTQAVLGDAESRQVSEKHVRLWLSRLRHAAYDVEDLLEDASNHAVSSYNVAHRIIDRYNVAVRIKEIRKRLDQIDVERNRIGFSSSPMGGDHRVLVRSQRLTTSLMDESEMVIGRENDKETMISRLVSGSSSNEDRGHVQVLAIAGIGGLGKTTLARLLYHDAKVRDHFNQDLYWVCVSEPFDVLRVTKDIIEEGRKETPTRSSLNGLQDELLQLLRGKRYLLVLDDVWNDDADKWEMLRLPLTSGANGSRILVTTRSEKVANTMNANYIHELKGLSDDQSWTLFSSRAFARKREGDCSEFESIGKGIVNKCKGVPLAIKVTGNAMNTKRTVEDWKNVLESKIWSLRQATDKILPALLLSYCHLPAHLKQCFAYCSIFPKDCQLEKDVLVRLWVAQGFIPSEGSREKEDIGDEYFDELVAWSMFQEVKENYKGKVTCKMHALLHDLAELIAKDEIYTFISKSKGGKSEECPGNSSKVRHAFLSFADSDDKPSILMAACKAKKLRTLWLDRTTPWPSRTVDGGIISVIDDLIHEARFLRALYFRSCTRLPKSICKLKHLRYLHLPWSEIAELPDAIGKMEQLRYLDLSHSAIVELPESVDDLRNLHTLNFSRCGKLEKLPRGIGGMVSLKYLDLSDSAIVELPESVSGLLNLHTLNVSYCRELIKLPSGMGGMVNLRHLELEETESLEYLPKGLGKISGLGSLCMFIVGGGDVGEGCGIEELQRLNSLQGNLQIKHLERVASREEAEKAQLWNKQHLRCLVLELFTVRDDDVETERIDCVLEGLRPHENLEDLQLFCSAGSKLPSWMDTMRCLRKLELISGPILERVPHLPSLEEIQISRLRNEILSDEGWERLVTLQKLKICNCEKLKCLPEGLTQLPSLEQLDICGCDKLESLPERLGQLKKLNSLRVRSSEELRRLPDSLGQLESLKLLSIYDLKKLESVPDSLGQLKALSHLDIRDCKALATLPQGLSGLSLLQYLDIHRCPLLRKRCKRGGVDWPNILHIPCILIDG